MMSIDCKVMRHAVERILKAHRLFAKFNEASEFAVRITNPPYMPLTIERHADRVTITHYFEQNGDLIPEPDMEFAVHNGQWLPIAMQFATGQYRVAIRTDEDEWKINRAEAKDQVEFAATWAKNLIEQGFEGGTAEIIS
jgi:hypothetical protein